MRSRSMGFVTVATLLVLTGLVAIAIMTWLPHSRAARTAAEEASVVKLLRPLLKAAMALPHFDLADPAQAELIAARVRRVTKTALVPLEVDPALRHDGIWYESGGYALCLRRSDPKHLSPSFPAGKPGPHTPRAFLEVYAWPRSRWSCGRSAFFIASDQPLAYSRNLYADHRGLEPGRVPTTGAGRPRDREVAVNESDYQGQDDDRWIQAR